jgi:hypothetical protein
MASTKLCLYEPDPELMIRRAYGQERARKSEHAAEDRKAEHKGLAAEGGVSAAITEFELFFKVELRAVQETMSQVVALHSVDDDGAQKLVDWWREQNSMLHGHVAGASDFLPVSVRERVVRRIHEQERWLHEQRERLGFRKVFRFKDRSRVMPRDQFHKQFIEGAPGGAVAAATAWLDAKRKDTFQAAAGAQGFRQRTGETLVRPAGQSTDGDFALESLERCEIRLLSSSRCVWIRGLNRCTVFAVPTRGAVYVTDCTDCTFCLGARQLRIHTSTGCDWYLHVQSNPIIEHCDKFRVAPYPPLPPSLGSTLADAGLRDDVNLWDQASAARHQRCARHQRATPRRAAPRRAGERL